jgi:hypothetical protein
MGVELELLLLLTLSVLARFGIETPAWRKILKWFLVTTATLALYRAVGHWALMAPLLAAVLGTTFHFVWCHKHGIHLLRATPHRTYYRLRGWQWPE